MAVLWSWESDVEMRGCGCGREKQDIGRGKRFNEGVDECWCRVLWVLEEEVNVEYDLQL